jgi:hypothetical protein
MDISATRSSGMQSTQKPTQAQQSRQQDQIQARAREASSTKPPDQTKPAPMVNTQGQTTGQLVNVTA